MFFFIVFCAGFWTVNGEQTISADNPRKFFLIRTKLFLRVFNSA